MNEYPDITVKLIGHTDSKGPADYNLKLSERRALAALNYMVDLGIDARRLTATGVGETNFAAINTNQDGSDNPEGRQLNRRVEFEITGLDSKLVVIKRTIIPANLIYK